jgi:RimJ/RimL family protein N-acetyltransferase
MPGLVIRSIDGETPRPKSHSKYEDWGEFDPRVADLDLQRWLIVLVEDGVETAIGDMSAHAVYYGPTPGSRTLNIGISLVEEFRGKGYGGTAQRLLAESLHAHGVVRVEAQTDVTNLPEQRALARAGFEFEGVLRRAQGRADGLHDIQVWSHLA